MATLTQSNIGNVVSFQIYPSAILTDDFTNVRIVGIVNHEVAAKYISPAQRHANVYPTLPEGTPNDYRLYEYAIIRKQDGSETAIGLPWIKEETISVSTSVELVITVRDKSITDIPRLRQILTSNGFSNVTVTTTSGA